MSPVNKKVKKVTKPAKPTKAQVAAATSHVNHMGGTSWNINNPINNLRIAASSCFFGEPKYYIEVDTKKPSIYSPARLTVTNQMLEDLRLTLGVVSPKEWLGQKSSTVMESAITQALDYDVEETLKLAADLRQNEHIRTTPQVILVMAANHPDSKGTSLIRQYAPQILKRADEPAVALAYQLEKYKDKPIPNSLKKALRYRLSTATEYELAKYRSESRVVKLVDVMNLTHPKSPAINKLAKGELVNTGETWEAIISAEGSTPKAWEKASKKMGHMALLRNLRNLEGANVLNSTLLDQLREGVKDGQQLPFRYFSAYSNVSEKATKAALEDCIEMATLYHLPKFKGRVISLCDNSGSAQSATTSSMGTMNIATIANLTGVLTAKASEEGYVGIFGDRLEVYPVAQGAKVLRTTNDLGARMPHIGGGTEHGIWLFLDKAIRTKEHWDHIFIYSDMQAGHGGLYGTGGYSKYVHRRGGAYIDVAKLVSDYRTQVNKNVMVYLVQVAGYQDTIIPEFYDRTFILGGWSDNILRFASRMSQIFDNKVD